MNRHATRSFPPVQSFIFVAISVIFGGLTLFPNTSTLRAAEIDRSLILTPPAPETPRINSPNVFGGRPGSPFLYTIPATGRAPLEYAVAGLPAGLQVDDRTGRITGVLKEKATHAVTLGARNSLGASREAFRINQEKVLSSAKVMVARGLQAHGWTYVNIDDGWQGKRGGKLNTIQPNSKFPDMAALGKELHAPPRKGLRLPLVFHLLPVSMKPNVKDQAPNVGWLPASAYVLN